MPNWSVISVLARSFLAGEPSVDRIVARGSRTLGRPYRWLRPLSERYAAAIAGRTRPRHRDVVQFLLADPDFTRAWPKLAVKHWMAEPQRMQPAPAAASWNVPPLDSAGALADWLRLTAPELEWFADLKALACKQNLPRLSHYHYRVLHKRSGDIRLIESPKQRLKQLQRRILTRILEPIPIHPAVHGFVKRRSIKTFVAPHVGQRVILRMDLRDFFPSFSGPRMQAFFRTAGYPESVADLLGGICTNAVPRHVWDAVAYEIDRRRLRQARDLYSRPHLPQGAPTSPALANLCTYRVDCRLAGLANAVGAQYTRYADDLAFSGGESFARRIERFSTHVAAILHEEGFSVHHRKTRVMRQGVRQHLTGLVANQHLNVIRADFDRLKATLNNCVRHGPETQNRESHPDFRAHLQGRIAFMETINLSKGERLRKIFNQIHWP